MYNHNIHGMQLGNQHYYPNQPTHDFRDVKGACQKYMNYHVVGQMADGSQVEGIVDGMDDEGVTMLVPEMVEDDGTDTRVFGGFGGGHGRRRFRRFRRRRFPYFQFVFPFFYPFPYFY